MTAAPGQPTVQKRSLLFVAVRGEAKAIIAVPHHAPGVIGIQQVAQLDSGW